LPFKPGTNGKSKMKFKGEMYGKTRSTNDEKDEYENISDI